MRRGWMWLTGSLCAAAAGTFAGCDPGERIPLPADHRGYAGDQQGPPEGVPRGEAEGETRYEQGSYAGEAEGGSGIGAGIPEIDEDIDGGSLMDDAEREKAGKAEAPSGQPAP